MQVPQSILDRQELLTNSWIHLKVLAQCEKGDRLCTETGLFSIEAGGNLLQGIRRKWGGESRFRNMERITQLVDQVVLHTREAMVGLNTVSTGETAQARFLRVSATNEVIRRSIDALDQSQRGLRNLAVTYEGDAPTVAQLAYIKESIRGFVRGCAEVDQPQIECEAPERRISIATP
jgi:hypothetical protein